MLGHISPLLTLAVLLVGVRILSKWRTAHPAMRMAGVMGLRREEEQSTTCKT